MLAVVDQRCVTEPWALAGRNLWVGSPGVPPGPKGVKDDGRLLLGTLGMYGEN